MNPPLRLITIGPSHYCEKARWALDRLKIPYTEHANIPLFHWARSLPHKSRTVPILITPKQTLRDSTDILQYLDTCADAPDKLYPNDPTERARVEELEELFDRKLGPHIRRWAYLYILPDRALATKLFAGPNISARQKILLHSTFPAIAQAMNKGLNINPASAERSKNAIENVLSHVDDLLSDGRPYLTGTSFTAADLTFAALSAPIVRPDAYGYLLPPLARMPQAIQDTVEATRKRPAGQLTLRLYREHRIPYIAKRNTNP